MEHQFATVGSVPLYGDVPDGKKSPERLRSRYAARMPEVHAFARTVKLSKSQKAALVTERTYFERNRHRMEYARFRARGWAIGSGPGEAACKRVVKTRRCRSVMHWSRDGGQHILSLRTSEKSNRWDAQQ